MIQYTVVLHHDLCNSLFTGTRLQNPVRGVEDRPGQVGSESLAQSPKLRADER